MSEEVSMCSNHEYKQVVLTGSEISMAVSGLGCSVGARWAAEWVARVMYVLGCSPMCSLEHVT